MLLWQMKPITILMLSLISEADETVEVVADIDVPVLHHDDPQPVDPDYEAEIEREFAGIAERADSLSEERLS